MATTSRAQALRLVRGSDAPGNVFELVTTALTEAVSGAILSVPMMHGGKAIGAITLGRKQPGDYSPAQVAFVQTFAEQAVIAVGNAETYRVLT